MCYGVLWCWSYGVVIGGGGGVISQNPIFSDWYNFMNDITEISPEFGLIS